VAVDEEVFDFASGGQAVEEFVKDEKAAQKAARGRAGYVSSYLQDDGDSVIIRPLFECELMGLDRSQPIGPENPHDPTTGWIWTKMHNFVKTKGAPKDKPKDAKWPEKVSAVCRRTPVGRDQHPLFPECILDGRTTDRGYKETPRMHLWTTAVVRDQVVVTPELAAQRGLSEKMVGKKTLVDKMDLVDEVDSSGNKTGNKIWKRHFVIVNMRLDNFFSSLISFSKYYETSLDRDYLITRKGPKGEKHEHQVTPLDPFEVTVERNDEQVRIRYDLREPEVAAVYAADVQALGLDRQSLIKKTSWMVSDPYYRLYFDERYEGSWKDLRRGRDDEASSSDDDAPPLPAEQVAKQEAGQSVTAEPKAGVSAEQLEALRARVMQGNAPAAADSIPSLSPVPQPS
jgi:hypothetical protein